MMNMQSNETVPLPHYALGKEKYDMKRLLSNITFWLLIFSVIAIPALSFRVQAADPQQDTIACSTLHTSKGPISVVETVTADPLQSMTSHNRNYYLYNGDTVTFLRQVSGATSSDAVCVKEYAIPHGSGTVRWYDAAQGFWQTEPLAAGIVQASCIYVATESHGEFLIYTPKIYQSLGSGTLQYYPDADGYLNISEYGDGFLLQLMVPELSSGRFADATVVRSPLPILDWSVSTLGDFWKHYTLDTEGKWCYDGYYFPSPTTYVPSGTNCLYRLPAAYLCKSFAHGAPAVRAAEDLAVAMLDVMSRQQNSWGYFPTLPESQWLSGDYGIPGGFYDTRFNTDLVEIFYQLGTLVECREFQHTISDYFDFFLYHAASHHTLTANGGWLVEDYWNPAGGTKTHTSLNHQLAEILTLYHHADQLGREDLRELADRMLLGIQDTAELWIRPDGNLHYAIYADGTYGGTDYPYLTYNDLYYLQQYLEAHGKAAPELQVLMSSKRAWMDANGIDDYAK
jgi:hypothetical protein